MNVDELTIGQVKQLSGMLGNNRNCVPKHDFKVGKKYFIRTVTHHYLGLGLGLVENGTLNQGVEQTANERRLKKQGA